MNEEITNEVVELEKADMTVSIIIVLLLEI